MSLTFPRLRQNSQSAQIVCREQESRSEAGSTQLLLPTKVRYSILLLMIAAVLAIFPGTARSQAAPDSEKQAASDSEKIANPIQTEKVPNSAKAPSKFIYIPPTQRTKATVYLFDAYGPYPILGSAVSAGFSQLSNAPPEWHQGAEGYAKRFGSSYAFGAIATTTRYALSEAFKEDALFYRCECNGFFPRVGHAALSTLTARRGKDGHRVFSLPSLLGPYVGSTVAVYSWYPERFGIKDAFRMGNYNLLSNVGENIALEFFYKIPYAILARMHLSYPQVDEPQGSK